MSRFNRPNWAERISSGMAMPLLREISAALDALAAKGAGGAIDLGGLPLTETDRAELEAVLGTGEVEAKVTAAGVSEVRETAYAGVWWIRHLDAGGRVLAETIEITRVPELLQTQVFDIDVAARRLRTELTNSPEDETGRETVHAN
ncbi:MAG: hypothetical protein KDJ16_07490 [Hyphomicrobiales bacterium]|nr:hypothetical protein [Hyphomicrobiales bacterium]